MGGERERRERERGRERGEFFNTISLRGNVDATFVGRV
jgi:hypothetical protein